MLSNVATNRPVVEPPDHEGKLNYISKYLVQYAPLKKAPNSATKFATDARVLTSEDAQSIFLNKKRREKKRRKKNLERLRERERDKKEKKLQRRKQNKLLRKRKKLLEGRRRLLREIRKLQEKS